MNDTTPSQRTQSEGRLEESLRALPDEQLRRAYQAIQDEIERRRIASARQHTSWALARDEL
ncbi:MAG: hypothetical protein O3B84_01305 [Chloroflexi bacterium]|nr:hypothetical protein [Chloroflexota bacterium]